MTEQELLKSVNALVQEVCGYRTAQADSVMIPKILAIKLINFLRNHQCSEEASLLLKRLESMIPLPIADWGIVSVFNSLSGDRWVGCRLNPEEALKRMQELLTAGNWGSHQLQHAWQQNPELVVFEVLEDCFPQERHERASFWQVRLEAMPVEDC